MVSAKNLKRDQQCGIPARSQATKNELPDDDEVISLFEASKRLGLRERSRTNWTPLLKTLCLKGLIDVRPDDDGIPVIRSSSLERLGRLVQSHFDRPRIWPPKKRSDTIN